MTRLPLERIFRILLIAWLVGLSSITAHAQVLIGVNRIAGGYNHGWRLYNYNGQYISQVAPYYNVYRYIAGLAVEHGSGFTEVTGLITRSDNNNQIHYLCRWRISDGASLESLASTSNGFNSSNIWEHHDGTYMPNSDGIKVYGWAVNKKVEYTPSQLAYGTLMDGNVGTGIDFGPYYNGSDGGRQRRGLTYDPSTGYVFVSNMLCAGGDYDVIEVYAIVNPNQWTLLASQSGPVDWGKNCHIMAMSMGPDYNGDGSYDLFAVVQNGEADGGSGYNRGYNFWTVLAVEVVNQGGQMLLELRQISPPYTIEAAAGTVYSIALDMYQPMDDSVFTCEQLGVMERWLAADINGDCRVDLSDYSALASHWLQAAPVVMPAEGIDLDAVTSSADGTNGTTLSWSHTLGTGKNRVLVVGLAAEDGILADLVISSVTFNGAAMHPVPNSTAIAGSSTRMQTVLYYMLENELPTAGTYTVEAVYAGEVSDRIGGAVSLKNVDQAVPAVAATNANLSSRTIATSVTTLIDGAWIVDMVGCGNGGSFAALESGRAELFDCDAAASSSSAGAVTPAGLAGTKTLSWRHSDAAAPRLTHSLAVFSPAAP